MGRDSRRRLEALLGGGLVIVLAVGVLLVWESFEGAFGNTITVSARLSQATGALATSDPVVYRSVVIGKVLSTSSDKDGSAVLRLRINALDAAQVPANVTAIAVPQTLFGATEVQLLPPVEATEARLRDGADIAPNVTQAAISLQGALTDGYNLLASIHPADLDAALNSLATALDGQGPALNAFLDQVTTYLQAIEPELPALEHAVATGGVVSGGVARNINRFRDSVNNLLGVAAEYVNDRSATEQLLGVAPGAVAAASAFLSPANLANLSRLFGNEVPVSGALAAQPRALVETIEGFKAFAHSFATAMSSGPYVHASVVVTGIDLAELASVVSGGKGHIFDGTSDPPRYAAADCPRYPGLNGPACVGMTSASAHPVSYGGTSGAAGSSSELSVVDAYASALTNRSPAEIPPAVDLVLGPMVSGAGEA